MGMDSQMALLLSKNQAVNHEFINSLSSVRSLSQLLVDYPGLDAGERTRFLSMINEETARLMHLLDQLTPSSDHSASP
jgi:nitrogen-specific signal transduction histidine kinase